MTDIVDQATRSRMMSGIRGKNTKPEIEIRRSLFVKGFRYRLHVKVLPGSPDIVLPKHNAIIFVHGCFWHRHTCGLFKLPQSNISFWDQKLARNQKNDEASFGKLKKLGWRIAIVWECALKGSAAQKPNVVADRLERWIKSTRKIQIIQGRSNTVE